MSKFENVCPICGREVESDGRCPVCDAHKKMCLNCMHCKEGDDNELYCRNEENLNDAISRAKEAIGEIKGYSLVSNIEMAPIALKKPSSKCARWSLKTELIDRFVESFE